MYATLIAHGHRLSDIRDAYTEDQVSLFYFLAIERDNERALAGVGASLGSLV